jgi:crotonobetainyl-CoA:carnitine CoA-transferase CaiB-like acyl-CoA transferase
MLKAYFSKLRSSRLMPIDPEKQDEFRELIASSDVLLRSFWSGIQAHEDLTPEQCRSLPDWTI